LGRRPLGAVLHSSYEPGELSQWFCNDDSTINIVLDIIIIIIIIIIARQKLAEDDILSHCESLVDHCKYSFILKIKLYLQWSTSDSLVPFSSYLTLNNTLTLKSGLEVTRGH